MMEQKLYFEPAWERTISDQDRKMIEKQFDQMNHRVDGGLQSTYLRHAVNHRGRLLYTAILHNYMDREGVFQDRTITLLDLHGNWIADAFTLPVPIPAYTSMPWTFIFPKPNEKMEAEKAVLVL